MKTSIQILLLTICSFVTYAQRLHDFKNDFKIAISNKVTNETVDSLMRKHNSTLVWFYNVGTDVKTYPLAEMRNESLYLNNIDKLFADTGKKVNTLACLIVAAVNDTTKIPAVKNVLLNTYYKNMLAAKSLMVLGDKDLSLIAKCIIANDFNETVQYLTLEFLQGDKRLMEKFAVDNLFSNNNGFKYLAIKAMGEVPSKPENIRLLGQAVVKYDTLMKGWPITLLAQYKAQDILPLVKQYLNNKHLREVSLRALVASEDHEDMMYVKQLINEMKFDRNFMDLLLYSGNDFYIESWLKMFENNMFPANYYFDVRKSRLQGNKKYFNQVTQLILNYNIKLQSYSLMRYFEGWTDNESRAFLNKCLTHENESIREEARRLVSENKN